MDVSGDLVGVRAIAGVSVSIDTRAGASDGFGVEWAQAPALLWIRSKENRGLGASVGNIPPELLKVPVYGFRIKYTAVGIDIRPRC